MFSTFNYQFQNNFDGTLTSRGGLAIGRTGRIPGGLAANLARYPTFFFFFYVVVFACRMYTKVIISKFAIQ